MLERLTKLFDSNEKELRRLRPLVQAINALEPEVSKLSDGELQAKTGEFRQRLDQGATLDDLLPEAFAVVREAARRVLGMRPYDVQLMGGIVLHQGRIAEMKTGEGKTLVATLPVYLNALTGRGVHVVTVNDYLARRDAEWMGAIYRFLGLSVGTIVHGLDLAERRQAYACDITYGTNNEFGFDYLRDNMVLHQEQMVQRGLVYAIVDEVDSILIDEARTPLIISGPGEASPEWYYRFAQLVPRLKRDEDYTVDEKARTVALTEAGVAKVEKELGIENLFDDVNWELAHYLNQALKAHTLFKRDRDYVVKDGEVIIVDEFTGRLMFGRRYSDGLHQAIEAKERVKIQQESQTLASITFQNYFRMYEKLAGMTGTAKTEEEEFMKIYGMDVVVIPTNTPMIRKDYPDVVYKTEKAKFEAVVEEIVEMHKLGRPVLVGTVSIEKSERLSAMLKRRGVPHQVLNAKYHEKEAEIVAQAGRLGAVTIATNMAGRGTDIMLGGNPDFLTRQEMRRQGYPPEVIAQAAEKGPVHDPEVAKARQVYQEIYQRMKEETDKEHDQVVALGGLHVIGTERHESRRIDNQLRGRAGRQGDPGSSRFFVALEDDLMRLFGSERITALMERLGWEDDQPIEHAQVSRALENAQKKVEARNFEIRKQVLEYDDVLEPAAGDHLRAAAEGPHRREPGAHHPPVHRGPGYPPGGQLRPGEGPPRGVGPEGPGGAVPGALQPAGAGARRALGERGPGGDHRAPHRRGASRLPEAGGAAGRAGDPGAGAPPPPPHGGPQVDRPPAEHGRPAGGHRPPGSGPAPPPDRVPARGLCHVSADGGGHPGGYGQLPV